MGSGACSDSASQFRAMSSRDPQVTRDPVFKASDGHRAWLERMGESGEKTGFRLGGRNDNGVGSGVIVVGGVFSLCFCIGRILRFYSALIPLFSVLMSFLCPSVSLF